MKKYTGKISKNVAENIFTEYAFVAHKFLKLVTSV